MCNILSLQGLQLIHVSKRGSCNLSPHPLKTNNLNFLKRQLHIICVFYPNSNIHGANMGPTWVLLAPDGPHVGPMNLVIWVHLFRAFINIF